MQAPDGYRLQKSLIASPRVAVYLALRESDGAEVVLKAYPERGPFAAPERAEREHEILRSLPPGVSARPLALERTDEHRVLVLERLAGEIPRGAQSVRRFLALAIGAAQAVSRIHAARIVHRNLRPENLLARADFAEVRILGCSHAAPLGAPGALGDAGSAFDGPLLYMAPEQTGRLERGVDFRSDLYALGATFYELLSGRPPFDARDPLDLIHAHIAHRARPLVEVAPEISGTLSRIAMKLLEKEPEDRYQTAEALQIDLESCREQLERTGAIDDELPLGAADAPYRPLFRQRVYGREVECAALARAYARASGGAMVLLLVRGAPGVGKSALVPELHRPLALDGGYLVRGKFDLYRGHVPYAGFASALGSLLRQVASESEERRAGWRRTLSEALGPLAAVVAELTPELTKLLGELAPVPRLEPLETQQRLALAVRRFLLAAARHAQPLVLFLDDLQWADAGSRYLLEELLAHPGDEASPLLAIGSYRDSEVGSDHPLQLLLERLERQGSALESVALGPLSDQAACELLADALGHPRERVRELAARVARHSGNNPLLIQQCVYHLHELGCLRFAQGQGWTWDFAAIDAAVIPEDPVGMMLAKLQRLRGEARSVAQFASCVGDEFDVELLAELSRRERGELESALYELSDEGLIAPCRAGFRFVHDRIREAAQALLPELQRAELHLRTATLLLERTSPDEQRARCFEIADHLWRAASAIPDDVRMRAIELHRSAGICALEAGACATAAHYTQAGLALLRPDDWELRPDLGFDLHLRASECAYQMRDYARALAPLEALEQHCSGDFQSWLVAAQRIKIYALSRSVDETLELTLATLRDMGQPLPLRPGWLRTLWEIARTDWQLRGPEQGFKFHPPTQLGPWIGELMVRSTGGQAMSMTSTRLMCLNCAAIVRTTLRHGHIATPGFALAAYAAYRGAALRRASGMQRYADAALGWCRRVPDPRFGARVELIVEAFVRTWTGPRRDVLDPLRRLAASLQEVGSVEYATNALLMRAHYLGLTGAALSEVVGAFEQLPLRGHLTPIEEPHSIVAPYRLLCQADADPAAFARARPELERFAHSAQFAATHWMLALCVLGRFADAWWAAELVRPIIFERVATAAHLPDYMLFRGVAAAAQSPRPSLRLRLAAARCQRYLRRWARHGPDFTHMATLLHAERTRAAGRDSRALDLYARAAAGAEAQHHVHHAAFAHERRGALLRSLGREPEACAALHAAHASYRAWGAAAKLR